jgi:hypothetical protein
MSRLYDALRRAEAERERIRNGGAPLPPPADEPPRRPLPRPRARSAPQLASFARGLLIFASGAALALAAVQLTSRLRPHSGVPVESHAARPEAQPALSVAPTALKLDYRLDLTRAGGAAR